jgi:hypothetical protein
MFQTFFWFDNFCGESKVVNFVESHEDTWQSDNWSLSDGDGRNPHMPTK